MYRLLDENGNTLITSETTIEYNPVNPGWHVNGGSGVFIDPDKKYTIREVASIDIGTLDSVAPVSDSIV